MQLTKPPGSDMVQIHVDRNDAPLFSETQPGRVVMTRDLLRGVLAPETRSTVWELGCGAADVSGPFSDDHDVHGVDVVPIAETLCRSRWPKLSFHSGRIEDVEPQDSHVLVLTEVLEHLTDPLRVVADWMPRAEWSIVGHPLVGDQADDEPGHRWTYTYEDFTNWFTIGGHELTDVAQFNMGRYPMIVGVGVRRG